MPHGHAHPHDHGDERAGDHAHVHPHEHPHSSPEARHVPQAGAVLDIGGDVGALLVHAEAQHEGAEIELYDEGGRYLMHTEVHARSVNGRTRYDGLFPVVPAGAYLLETGAASRTRIQVSGGEVAIARAS